MKNANVFVDVDLTLVDQNQNLLPGAAEALRKLHAAGCHLFLWSSVGADYAKATSRRFGFDELFEGFAAKPDIVIDDMPGTTRAPFAYNVLEETSWPDLAAHIISKHVDSL